jgi:hypothetical protein
MVHEYVLKIFDFYTRPVKFLASVKDEKDFKKSFFFASVIFFICETVTVDNYFALRISFYDFFRKIILGLFLRLIILFVVSSIFFIILRGFIGIRFHQVFRIFSWMAAYFILLSLLNDVNVLVEYCLYDKAAVFTGLVVLKCLLYLWMARVLAITVKNYSGMTWPRLIVMLCIYSIAVGLILFILRFAGLGLKIIVQSIFI